jgi:acetyl-CoA carboxylase carboxyltransferase component
MPGDWNDTLEDLRRRRAAARSMGGPGRLARQRTASRMDARSRLDHLLDSGSWMELGTLAGGEDVPADAVVMGSGRIDGRPVMVVAEDFTVQAGTIGAAANAKRHRAAELARADRVPLVMLLDGAGFRAEGHRPARSPTDLLAQADCSGRVPVVSAVLGVSAGHGALVVPLSDFSVMSDHAAVFTAGPPVVAESLGEQVTKEELGGPAVAVASGLIHNVEPDDAAALDLIRLYLSYFPSSAWSYPPDGPGGPGGDRGPRPVPELADLVPRDGRRAYDMRLVLDVVFDAGSWWEVQPEFGSSLICALARLGGHPVAVVANQPLVLAGAVDADAADKAAHFIEVADSFHLPLVFLADNPGVLPGRASERRGILRSGARMWAAQHRATSPRLQVTLRKAYGFGSVVMAMLGFEGQSAVFAFPGATLGAMGASALSRATGAAGAEAERLRRAELDASYRSAAGLGFDELIDPAETRDVLLHSLERALNRRSSPPEPKFRAGITP